ncbi:MAG TPA: hypothetical protein VGV86_14025 [Acidimicrobiales bacterium]|nr:hypothetical protein [Acidimicrobiales bacterium]
MSNADAIVEPFGHTTLRRQRAGALVVMVGSGPLALMVLADAKPYLLLLAIGAIATGAWLVDGRRYLGPGTVALGLGIGLALAQDFDLAKYELPLVLAGIGVPLTIIRFVNAKAVLGAAGLLVYAAISGAILDRTPDPIESGWGFVILMVVWGGIQLARVTRPVASTDGPAGR